METKIDRAQVDELRRQLLSASARTTDDRTRDALTASLRLLDAFVEAPRTRPSLRNAVSMDYTFEDEDYEPHGRQIDIRIYYDWNDYDPADEPSATWGPTIADMEVLGVRYLDAEGHEVAASEHYAELAWELLNKYQREIIEACTAHGYHNDIGKTPTTYCAQRLPSTSTSAGGAAFVPRLAPSEPTRQSREDRRQFG